MLSELEAAILARLESNGINSKIFDFKTDERPRAENVPTVFCQIEEAKFSKQTMISFLQEVSIFLVVTFKNMTGEADRRSGIYPILEGIIQLFTLQNLDLSLRPLRPIGFKNITDKDDARSGEILYQIEFWTAYTIEKTAESAVDLLRVGMEYYLQDPEDDGVKDAEDLVELDQ